VVPVLLVIALTLVAGCLGTAESERSVETVELTASTPVPHTVEPRESSTIRFLGPGPGESAVIADGSNVGIVVDTGADPNATSVRRALSRADIEYYDLWITGFNETRFGGAPSLVRTRPPSNIGFNGLTASKPLYNRFLHAVVATNRQHQLFGETSQFVYGQAGGTLSVLAPPESYLADRDPAHNEIVLRYDAHEITVLWLGDPGKQETQWLLAQRGGELNASVLVLSAGATPSDRLLSSVDPETVVVQGREGANRTAELVGDASVDVYRPGIEGTVTLRIVEDDPTVHTTLGTPPTVTPTEAAPTNGANSTVTLQTPTAVP
jgi:beta-lactamase superfamily II metal-dependent hydrolase